MQSVIYAKLTKTDLMLLFGIGADNFNRWLDFGLPCERDGTYILTKVLRWYRTYNQVKEQRQIKPGSLLQKRLAELLGVTRQTVTAWSRAGLPRRSDGTYNLADCVSWLRGYYQQIAKREYSNRLETIQKKLCRTARQQEKYIVGSSHI